MVIKPGLNVKIVTEIDHAGERIHARSSTVHVVGDQTIVLAQTEPPIPKSMLHKEIIITYLSGKKEGCERYGFPARIYEFVDDYHLSSSERVKALTVVPKAGPTPFNIRMFYRVGPSLTSNVCLFLNDQKLNIIDISLRGVRFSFDRKMLSLEPAMVVELHLDVYGKTYPCEANILRVWREEDERFRGVHTVASAEFNKMGTTLEHILARKLRAIEQEQRYIENLT